jgi:RNA polymerase sigma factor (sigma-70 family)
VPGATDGRPPPRAGGYRGQRAGTMRAASSGSPTRTARPETASPPRDGGVVRDGERTDAAIIARSQDDPEVFATVFDRHYDAIHRFLWGRVGRDAEDLTAEVFRIAFERRGDYDTAYPSAKPWLFGIASRLAKESHRARARTDEVRTRLDREARTGVAGPEQHLTELAPDAALAAALEEVEERDREPLLLHAWADLSYEQVAAALDIPLGTVRSRIHRARHDLRDRLDEDTAADATRRGGDDG